MLLWLKLAPFKFAFSNSRSEDWPQLDQRLADWLLRGWPHSNWPDKETP